MSLISSSLTTSFNDSLYSNQFEGNVTDLLVPRQSSKLYRKLESTSAKLRNSIRVVKLQRDYNTDFGFALRGGFEHSVGFFVSDVLPDTPASRGSLRVGDKIQRINGYVINNSIMGDVVKLIHGSTILILRIEIGNKLPIKRNSTDVLSWIPAGTWNTSQLDFNTTETFEDTLRTSVPETNDRGSHISGRFRKKGQNQLSIRSTRSSAFANEHNRRKSLTTGFETLSSGSSLDAGSLKPKPRPRLKKHSRSVPALNLSTSEESLSLPSENRPEPGEMDLGSIASALENVRNVDPRLIFTDNQLQGKHLDYVTISKNSFLKAFEIVSNGCYLRSTNGSLSEVMLLHGRATRGVSRSQVVQLIRRIEQEMIIVLLARPIK